MANVFISVGTALRYAGSSTFKKPLRWLLLTVISAIEVFSFSSAVSLISAAVERGFRVDTLLGIFLLLLSIFLGLFFLGLAIKVMGRREFRFPDFLETVWCGFRGALISFLYLLVPVVLTFVLSGSALYASGILNGFVPSSDYMSVGLAGLGILLIPMLILFLVFLFFLIPALMNFARRNAFSAAFDFAEIRSLIGLVKWYWLLVGIFVFVVVNVAFSFVLSYVSSVLVVIPFAGLVFSVVVYLFFSFIIFFFSADYWAEVFA